MSALSKSPKLDDEAVVAICTRQVGQSVGFSESRLSKERERVMRYYDGEYPKKAHDGDSGYMSLDVYDAVEDMKAQLLETFSGNKTPVKFATHKNEDDDVARVRTDYVTDIIMNRNGGFGLFQETIDQGLLSRNAIVKAWWEPKVKTEYIDLSDTSFEEIQAYLTQHPEAEPDEVDLHEDGVTIKRMRLKLKKDTSQVRVELLAGEEFGIAPMAESIERADFVFHRKQFTVSELIKAGYPKDKVEALQDNDSLWLSQEPEKLARFEQTDDLIGTHTNEDGQTANRQIMVYEAYLMLDLEDEGESQLFKVTYAGNILLDKEPVDRKPFIDFCPLPRPKAFWGHNYAKLVIHTQNARTYLTRAIINHAMTTTNPRLMVVNGGLMNPKELMENKFGGLVNVKNPEAVVPLPQANLNPFVFSTIEMLKANKEEITSISSVSQGLDKDAISKQNSGDMIHELISVSQIRQKVVARNFAEKFLRALYLEVYRLVLENAPRQDIIKTAGSWTPVSLDDWPEETSVSVDFALGYGEAQKEVEKWANIHAALTKGFPALAGQYGPPQQYIVARRGLEAAGVMDIDAVLLPPNKAQQVPPNPLQQAEIAMKQADAKAKEASAQVQMQKMQIELQEMQAKAKLEMAKINLETMKVQAEIQLKQDALAHKVAVDAAEIALQQEAQQADKLSTMAEPTR